MPQWSAHGQDRRQSNSCDTEIITKSLLNISLECFVRLIQSLNPQNRLTQEKLQSQIYQNKATSLFDGMVAFNFMIMITPIRQNLH